MDKISSCPHKDQCCPKCNYGKIRYTKKADDINPKDIGTES